MSEPNPKVVRAAWLIGLGVLLVVLIIDWTTHHHANFESEGITIDTMTAFYPLFGFAGGLGLVILAKTLAIALKRKDTFYADD
jgi:hypothetical protein